MLSVNILGYLRKAKNQLDFEGTTEKVCFNVDNECSI